MVQKNLPSLDELHDTAKTTRASLPPSVTGTIELQAGDVCETAVLTLARPKSLPPPFRNSGLAGPQHTLAGADTELEITRELEASHVRRLLSHVPDAGPAIVVTDSSAAPPPVAPGIPSPRAVLAACCALCALALSLAAWSLHEVQSTRRALDDLVTQQRLLQEKLSRAAGAGGSAREPDAD